jgi:hypothetical protein
MTWQLSHRADARALPLADRHYNRQKIGTPQFVPPGSCFVLLAVDGGSLWVTSWPRSEYVQHSWPGAWMNSLFRRETTPVLASELIREAVAGTRWFYGAPPSLGMLTFIDASKVRRKRDVGRCYRRAGFQHVGFTKGGLWAFQLEPDDMPEPEAPMGTTCRLFDYNERIA